MSTARFTQIAGACAIAACPVGLVSFFLGPAAYGWDFDVMFAPQLAVAFPTVNTTMVRWGWVLDIVGYYFLLLPAVLVLGERSRADEPLLTRLSERMAVGYMQVGSLGAAILAGTTGLFERHRVGDAAQQAAASEVFIALFGMVCDGIWNILTMGLLAVWLLVGGSLLRREHRPLGTAMMFIGGLSALDVTGMLLGVEAISMPALFGYLFLFPVWSLLLGLWLVRGGAVRV